MILANSLKHEVANLIHEYENKALAAPHTGNKAEIQKSDHVRDHYMVILLLH